MKNLKLDMLIILLPIVSTIMIGCGVIGTDVIDIAGDYSMTMVFSATCSFYGGTEFVTGHSSGEVTITQNGDTINVGKEAKGKIDGDSVTFKGKISLGNTYNENLTFNGTVDDNGTISGTFSGKYSMSSYYPFAHYSSSCTIETGSFTMEPVK